MNSKKKKQTLNPLEHRLSQLRVAERRSQGEIISDDLLPTSAARLGAHHLQRRLCLAHRAAPK
jgi:hypothetical protein